MKWTVLVDNRTNNPALQTEHGLSVFMETERYRILLDTGAGDIFISNAERLGIDLSTVEEFHGRKNSRFLLRNNY